MSLVNGSLRHNSVGAKCPPVEWVKSSILTEVKGIFKGKFFFWNEVEKCQSFETVMCGILNNPQIAYC